MQKLFIFLILFICCNITIAQIRLAPDTTLEKQILASGLIHAPLPLETEHSYEFNALKKKVLYAEPFGKKERFSFSNFTGKRAVGSPNDADYATYGHATLKIPVNADLSRFNRIAFSVFPDCEGARVVNLDIQFPQVQSHLMALKNRKWNRCFLDIGDFERKNVSEISFSCSLKGRDITTGDSAVFYIENFEFQQIENPDKTAGWQPDNDQIIYSTTGYFTESAKTAIVNEQHIGENFSIIDFGGKTVFSGKIEKENTTVGIFGVVDFSVFTQKGSFKIKVENKESRYFTIGDDIFQNSLWRVLNFVFCQRCGYAVPGKHGLCHADMLSEHAGKSICYAGGWHDAGDLSQQTLQTGEMSFGLFEAYNSLKNRNIALASRLKEEALWGLDFILRNRYGDGFRASSMGLLIWTDGIFGTLDDIKSVRVQNMALDNFMYAAFEAYAAMSIDDDRAMQDLLKKTAKEDFDFAMKRYAEMGYGEFFHIYEHTYNTPKSAYMATVSWSASMLYKLTNEKKYAEIAAEFAEFVLDCQMTDDLLDENGKNLSGFFYADTTRCAIVHYNHQAREQIFMQALISLCRTQREHPAFKRWDATVKRYGNYLKNLMHYTLPYGMLPGGVYHLNEPEEKNYFEHLHIFAPENAAELHREQLKKGVPLGNGFYVKRFPAWFGIFNGNNAVLLSMGKAAAMCGNYLNDSELKQIGKEQMYWIVGKNPFGQSLISGEGDNYPQMDNFSSGESIGAMPVGIRSLGNEDIPYWPQINNACYKEVWVTSAGKWMSLQAEY